MYVDNNLSHEMLQHIFLLCLELSSLAGECIKRINDTGAVVVDLTCDNPASNWTMLEDLGARINHQEMKVSINKKKHSWYSHFCHTRCLPSNETA